MHGESASLFVERWTYNLLNRFYGHPDPPPTHSIFLLYGQTSETQNWRPAHCRLRRASAEHQKTSTALLQARASSQVLGFYWSGFEVSSVPELSIFEVFLPGLPVVFCGINPNVQASTTGHNFASASNRFWPVLHEAGFTPTRLSSQEDRSDLQYGCGINSRSFSRYPQSN